MRVTLPMAGAMLTEGKQGDPFLRHNEAVAQVDGVALRG